MKQLKAFTIIEMLVVLLLSTLVVVLASSAWLYFERLNTKINTDQSYLFGFTKFDYLIKSDINDALKINGTETDIYLEKNHQTIRYQFLDTAIVRVQNEEADTINFHYKKQIYKAEKSNTLITKIDFTFKLYNDSIFKSYSKWYDNKTLLEHSDN